MVMDDVIGVAMVMDDVRGSSLAPEEPIVRSLAQKCYFYTIFRDKMCQKEYYPKWDPVTQFYSRCTAFFTLQRKVVKPNCFD